MKYITIISLLFMSSCCRCNFEAAKHGLDCAYGAITGKYPCKEKCCEEQD